jgi:hypothetical protein
MGIAAKIGPGRVSDVRLSFARSVGEVAMNGGVRRYDAGEGEWGED